MFRQVKRRTAGRRNFEGTYTPRNDLPNHRLSFYDVPPTEEITLEQFESWAIDRLKILIEIESCMARGRSFRETETAVRPLLQKLLPLGTWPVNNNSQIDELKKDYYSHFILRLVFCRTEDLRRKFVRNETVLFKIRYNAMQPKEQHQFITNHHDKLPWNYIDSDEKLALFDQLFAATGATVKSALAAESDGQITTDQLRAHFRNENFIKVPFEKITSLVATRLVLLKLGYGYVPSTLQLSLLALEFQELLQRDLLRTFQSIPRLEEDDRLLPLLNHLGQNFASMEYDPAFSADPSLVSDINAASVTTPAITNHYPLCAKHLQTNMIASSHLRHEGRQQLSLFLKGIGLSVDEALKFWSHSFTSGPHAMTPERFNREFKYNIRHTYGLEGARTNYKPWDCARILLRPLPGKNEYHGCPYRDLSVDALTTQLGEMGVGAVDMKGVLNDVERKDYTVACTRVFEITHNVQAEHIGHPNLYFDRSRQLERAKTETA